MSDMTVMSCCDSALRYFECKSRIKRLNQLSDLLSVLDDKEKEKILFVPEKEIVISMMWTFMKSEEGLVIPLQNTSFKNFLNEGQK